MDVDLRCGNALCQDNSVEAIGQGTARGEQHAHIGLDTGDVDGVNVLEAEQSAQFRFEKRVEGMLFNDSGAWMGSELLNRLDQIGSPSTGMARVVPALRIAQEQRRSIASVRIVTG